MQYRHVSVMPDEVLRYLDCRPGKIYVDGTLGASGHARRICERIAPGGVLIGIDQDANAIANAVETLSNDNIEIHLVHDNYNHLPAILSRLGIPAVDGILLDLGLSLHQLECSGRGFSFQRDEPLDMRMDVRESRTAADIINTESREALARIFHEYGEERRSRKIAAKVAAARTRRPIETTQQLVQIVLSALPKSARFETKIHPATRVFMALRIAVNRELDALISFLAVAVDYLNTGGRLCVLSFHSLEDRIVKRRFKALAKGCECPPQLPVCVCGKKPSVRILTPRVIRPRPEEVATNPMARSTRLRAVEKL
jgi:16S rRNA (cytosine1402-N4)-methyltransferase